MVTIHALLQQAIPALTAAGIDSARLDAELLLAHVTGQTRTWIMAHPEYQLREEEAAQFRQLLARRLQREPLPYLLGAWEFYGLSFAVSPDVLIPRPETELLVEAVLAWAKGRPVARIADIGAGSGAIAVTLAVHLPDTQIIAVDCSSQALRLARKNMERHQVQDRLILLEGDLLAPVRAARLLPLDAIAANLPYIAEEELAGLMPEVREYEPRLALLGGPDGLALIARLIAESAAALAPGGLLALEVGAGQAERVADQLAANRWKNIRIITDYGGIPRHVLAECDHD